MKIIFKAFIKLYSVFISPMKPACCCRFMPTCSDYAMQAVEKHGAIKGAYLAIHRIIRCNPTAKSGWDPVPETFCLTHTTNEPHKDIS